MGLSDTSTRAVAFDFNGTLCDDEALLASIFAELLRERGIPLTLERYYAELAGLSDHEIAVRALQLRGARADPAAVADVVQRRSSLYRSRAAATSPLRPGAAQLVRALARRVPVAVVSGASRADVESVLDAAGLLELMAVTVCAEDVQAGKPDPEGYRRALEALGVREPRTVVAIEDSIPGITAARRAGLRVLALRGTVPEAELANLADGILDDLDPSVAEVVLDA
ncbi:MAG TPA: HAD family phosphatase [Solirubrobacteraceae bacterium]|nr:HAD family phosphatase [Solirubrobacteraceae bacterium]